MKAEVLYKNGKWLAGFYKDGKIVHKISSTDPKEDQNTFGIKVVAEYNRLQNDGKEYRAWATPYPDLQLMTFKFYVHEES